MSIAKTSPFQTKLVLLVGDLAQLPPICKHTLQQNDILCKSYHVKSTHGWKMAQQHFLSILMCHGTNLKYLQFLNIIQEKKPTIKEIQKVLSPCFLQIQEINFHIDRTTTILCTHKIDVEKYNTIFLQKHFPTFEIYEEKMDTNATNIEHIQPWLNNKFVNYIHTIAVDALVMFTNNINIQKRAINGAIATISSIIFDPKNNITAIEVQLTTNSIMLKMILKKHTFQHKYTYDGYYYKASFPITLAYAITSHNSQGATINSKVIINIEKAFAPGLTYFMFSKVTNRKNLKIIENLTPNDFILCTFEDD
jgi:ATP-dependent exoDNAse (exonuclease V) alpha subunit